MSFIILAYNSLSHANIIGNIFPEKSVRLFLCWFKSWMPSCPLPQLGVETAVKLELWLTWSLESERECNVEGRLTVKGYIDIVLERMRHHLFITSFWRTHTNTSARNAQLHNRSPGVRQSWIQLQKQLNTKGEGTAALCSLPS